MQHGFLKSTFLSGLALSTAVRPAAADNLVPSCPPTPMRVTRSIGGPTDYLGSYPGIPDLCVLRRSGEIGLYYFGSWRSDWPGAGSAYPAIKTVISGPKGTRDSFMTRSYPGLQWIDRYTNEGVENLTVDGHAYRTLRLSHERNGIEGNTYHSIITVWRDVETGAALKMVEKQIAGQSYGPTATWTATKVTSTK